MKYKNNPFNIRYSDTNSWLGQIAPSNGFCQFDTLEHGVRAFYRLMYTYVFVHNLRSVRDIVLRFAPPSENQTDKYIDYLESSLGFQSITFRDDLIKLAHFMAIYESDTQLDLRYLQSVLRISITNLPLIF